MVQDFDLTHLSSENLALTSIGKPKGPFAVVLDDKKHTVRLVFKNDEIFWKILWLAETLQYKSQHSYEDILERK